MSHEHTYRKVRSAINKGDLVRPDTCESCGDKPGVGIDGRVLIQAHHHDHDKALDVMWLCPKCHRQETPLPDVMGARVFGEKNGQAKLTHGAADAIRGSELGCKKLAKVYGVNKTTIQRIRNGTHWIAAAPRPPQGESI